MSCSLSHTDSEVEALVQKLIDEDKSRQNTILDLALQFEKSCNAKDDLKKDYEKCNDISQESRVLINTFLKEGSNKDYELNLSMYEKAEKIEKQMDAKLAWLLEKYYYLSQESIWHSSSQADLYLTEKELHQLHLDEEALRVTLEEKAMDEKAREEKIRQKQANDDDFFLEFGVFSPEYCIVSGGYGTVYKAELDHVDRKYYLAIEGENVREVPKKQSTVAVKCIFDMEDESGEQGFYAEIEMLTSCKHSNILALLGFCDEDSEMILVYEYISMHAPTENYWSAVKQILCYLHGTVEHDDRQSMRRFAIYLGSNLVSWTARKQRMVLRSSTEAEHTALADTVVELTWLQALLNELGIRSSSTPILWCDNVGATYLSANHIFHARTKHVEIYYHFVREK
nr:hypothetical protein [Tanacetum cinerariifolium]